MSRCKHLNGLWHEWSRIVHTRTVEQGVLSPEGTNEIGNIAGYIYECKDCGGRWEYPSSVGQPKWLQRIHEQLEQG